MFPQLFLWSKKFLFLFSTISRANNTPIPAVVLYDASSQLLTCSPKDVLPANSKITATLLSAALTNEANYRMHSVHFRFSWEFLQDFSWTFETTSATPKTILFTINQETEKRSVKLSLQTQAPYSELVGKIASKMSISPQSIKKIRMPGTNVLIADNLDVYHLDDGETIDLEVAV